jgi:hypothetical protein
VNWTTTDKLLLSGLLPSAASQARLRQLLGERAAEIDWPAAARRAQAQGTTSLLRFNLARADLLERVPPQTRAQLDEISRGWTARQLALVSAAERLLAALAGKGITALPLKGAALMLGGYYPQAGLRAAADLDLLVAPDQITRAEQVALQCGYAELDEAFQAPIRQRLRDEGHHAAARRGPSGLILELHYRAFHYTSRARDFGFAEMIPRAAPLPNDSGRTRLLPAPEDLGFHLIHHALVDLLSTRLILRTLADLYFIWQREPGAEARLERRAAEFGLTGAVRLTREALRLVAEASLAELDRVLRRDGARLLLDTALIEEPAALAEAARLFEFFDLRRRPLAKLANLGALVFTTRPHLARLYGAPATTNRLYLNYLRRPFDLLRRINWASLAPATLWRMLRLRKLTRGG